MKVRDILLSLMGYSSKVYGQGDDSEVVHSLAKVMETAARRREIFDRKCMVATNTGFAALGLQNLGVWRGTRGAPDEVCAAFMEVPTL